MPPPKDPQKYTEYLRRQSESKSGQTPWNKGKKGLQISWNKGKHHKPESNEKNRLAHLGKTPWNKGKRGSQRAWNKGKPWSEETRQKMSVSKIQNWLDPKFRENFITKIRAKWKDEEYAREMGRRQGRKPSKPEKSLILFLNTNFPNEWRYVGDYKFWIEGKNPDFININGRKAIIEYNGYYRHNKVKDEVKTKHYAQYGFKTLNLYPIDLKNEKTLIQTISNFVAS